MKLLFKTSKLLLFIVAFFATVTSQAMEQQPEEHFASFIETLNAAKKKGNNNACTALLIDFQNNLASQEPVEKIHHLVSLIHHAAPKDDQLAFAFSTILADVYSQNPMLSVVMKEQISPVVATLKEHKNVDALQKIVFIFSDNKASSEYKAIQTAIKDKIQISPLSISGEKEEVNDAQIARLLQEQWNQGNRKPSQHSFQQQDDEELALALSRSAQEYQPLATTFSSEDRDLENALRASLQMHSTTPSAPENENSTPIGFTNSVCMVGEAISHQDIEPSAPPYEEIIAPSAPAAEEFAEHDEENDLSIAIEHSLTPVTQPNQSLWQTAAIYGLKAVLYLYFGKNY